MTGTRSKTNRIAILLLFLGLFSTSAAAQDLPAKLDQFMTGLTNAGYFSGTVLVAKDHQIIFDKGYGMANYDLEVPNTPKVKFRLGSITKQFTSACILLLEERGKLSVNDPISKYVPDSPDAWKDITIAEVLNHSSGIPNYTAFPDYEKISVYPVTPEELVGRFKNKPLDFKPGSSWNYSNSGYSLLGYIIERVSGQTYEQFLTENILKPVGMNSTGFDHNEEVIKDRAYGYVKKGDDMEHCSYVDMSIPYSAGSLYSTTDDLFKWDEALFSGKVVSSEEFKKMSTVYLGHYGYGLQIETQFKTHKMIGHGGGVNGFHTFIARYPDDGITIVTLSNSEAYNPGRVNDLAAIVFGQPYTVPEKPQVVSVDPALFDGYVGDYQSGPGMTIKVTKGNGHLMLTLPGRSPIDLFAESETKYFVKDIDGFSITFNKGADGKVSTATFQLGQPTQLKKID